MVAGFDVYKTLNKSKNIGYMSQKFSLYENLSILENLEFFGGIYGLSMKEIKQKAKNSLRKLGLEQKNKMVSELPLGWKQKLAFSVAIFHQPEIVFLDEPTGGVDPITRRQFWDLIYDAAEQRNYHFVTTRIIWTKPNIATEFPSWLTEKLQAIDSPENLKKSFQAKTMDEVFYQLARGAKEDAD